MNTRHPYNRNYTKSRTHNDDAYQMGYNNGYSDGSSAGYDEDYDEDYDYDYDYDYDNRYNDNYDPNEDYDYENEYRGNHYGNYGSGNRMNQPRDEHGRYVSTERSICGSQKSYGTTRDKSEKQNSGTSKRGSAAMSKAVRTRIARMGGQASHGSVRSDLVEGEVPKYTS